MRVFATRSAAPLSRHRILSVAWRRVLLLLLLLVAVAIVIPSDGYLGPEREELVVRSAIEGQGFRFVDWEVQAIAQKLQDAIERPGADLRPEQRAALVTGYFKRVGRIGELNGEIERMYAQQGDAAGAAVKPLEAELAGLREERASERPAVERIIEQQVGTTLEELGIDVNGHIFPPVRFQFTESPNILVLSPRDRIKVERDVLLNPTMPVDQMERAEATLEDSLANRSALVQGTGGLGSYPTMVVENAAQQWVIDTVAHEWAHSYLTLRPLGFRYFAGGEMRTINETVAMMVGDEVSRLVMERYYPSQVWPNAWPRPLSMRGDWLGRSDENQNFSFGAFMRKTRLETDRLLSEGKIQEAETYMERRRHELLKQGYAIRKLNQAYFAFNGSYAVGAFATDPIGAKLRALRTRAGSLEAFIRTVARINDPSDLDRLLADPDAPV